MKRIILWVSIFLIILSILIFINGIFILNKKSIIGKWESIDSDFQYYYIFNEDKTCSYEMVGARLDCTYEENDDELIISYKGTNRKYTFKFRFEDDYLIIKDSTGKDNKFINEQKKD